MTLEIVAAIASVALYAALRRRSEQRRARAEVIRIRERQRLVVGI